MGFCRELWLSALCFYTTLLCIFNTVEEGLKPGDDSGICAMFINLQLKEWFALANPLEKMGDEMNQGRTQSL